MSGGNGTPFARDAQGAFDGTIVSACESTGISLEQMIDMMRWAKESDPRIAQFLDVWDALDASKQLASGTADAVRQQVGLKPLELLGIAANVACRVATYEAQIIAAVSHPRVVAKTVERALTDGGIADRMALHKAMGFLPTPKSSQTTIAIMQNAQANVTARSVVEVERPEETIRRLAKKFNESRGLPPVTALSTPVLIDHPEEGDDDDR